MATGATSLQRSTFFDNMPAPNESRLPRFEAIVWQGIVAACGSGDEIRTEGKTDLQGAVMQDEMHESRFEVVWPRGKKAYADSDTVARIADLSGKTVAAVWDYLFRGDEMFEIVSEKLAARYPGIRFVPYEAFGNVHGSRQRELVAALPQKLRLHEVDAVITSVGA
jgi:hypothetical protein